MQVSFSAVLRCTTSSRVLLLLLVILPGLASTLVRSEEFALFKSTNLGQSWTRSDTGLPARSRINALAHANDLFLAGTATGIYISTNLALPWRLVASEQSAVLSLAATHGKIFAGTDGAGLLASTDLGKTWATNTLFKPRKVRSLLTTAAGIYAGTDSNGVLVSLDAGVTWSDSAPGLPPLAQVFALATAGERIFAGLYGKGLYLLDPKTPRWTKVGPVSPLALASVAGTLVAGHNPGGLHWSSDLGQTWARGNLGPTDDLIGLSDTASNKPWESAPVWELTGSPKLVVAGVSSGIYLSRDRGQTWTKAEHGLPAESPGQAFLITEKLILAATQIQGHRQKN